MSWYQIHHSVLSVRLLIEQLLSATRVAKLSSCYVRSAFQPWQRYALSTRDRFILIPFSKLLASNGKSHDKCRVFKKFHGEDSIFNSLESRISQEIPPRNMQAAGRPCGELPPLAQLRQEDPSQTVGSPSPCVGVLGHMRKRK